MMNHNLPPTVLSFLFFCFCKKREKEKRDRTITLVYIWWQIMIHHSNILARIIWNKSRTISLQKERFLIPLINCTCGVLSESKESVFRNVEILGNPLFSIAFPSLCSTITFEKISKSVKLDLYIKNLEYPIKRLFSTTNYPFIFFCLPTQIQMAIVYTKTPILKIF